MKRRVSVMRPGFFSLLLMPIGFVWRLGLNVQLCGCHPFNSGTFIKDVYGVNAHVGRLLYLEQVLDYWANVSTVFPRYSWLLGDSFGAGWQKIPRNEENAHDCVNVYNFHVILSHDLKKHFTRVHEKLWLEKETRCWVSWIYKELCFLQEISNFNECK